MKKLLQYGLTVGLLSALAISQLPEPVQCQMSFGGAFAASCSMPCCKTQFPPSKCPMLKATPPKDFIASAAPILRMSLTPLYALAVQTISQPKTCFIVVYEIAENIRYLFKCPSLSVRAPPVTIYLENA